MKAILLLRQLAEQQDYAALRHACLELGASDAPEQALLALAHAQLGDAAAARELLRAVPAAGIDVDTRVDLAGAHLALGNVEHATAMLEATHRQAGDHPLLLARLAWCRLQGGNMEEAITLYERSVTSKPNLTVYLNLLKLYRSAERHDAAGPCLEAATRYWERVRQQWPDALRRQHDQELRELRLGQWFAEQRQEHAEAWVEQQREDLEEDAWCGLLSALARQLSRRNLHAQAEEWLQEGARHYPENAALYGQLAELALVQGRARHAIALLQGAIRRSQASGAATEPLWLRISAAALPLNPAFARRAAERARELLAERRRQPAASAEPSTELDAAIEVALADVEAQEQQHASAERRYREVLAARPREPGALQGLGRLALHLGRLDEAAELFERLKAIDPARGYTSLLAARRFSGSAQTLEQLEALARTPSLEGPVRSSLLLQLAAAWQGLDDHDRAFALAQEANAASRRLLQYDPRAHRQRCARIRHAFPKALFEHRAACGHPSTLPVFVVGMPRSGTTLIEQILAGHSRVHGAGELGTIPRVIAGLERWERHTGSGRCYPDCVDDLDAKVCHGIAETVLSELREYAPDATHVVDKLPHNFENIGLIKLLFPNARIISARRDPRDIAVSNYFMDYAARHAGMGFAYDLDWIGEQLADHNLLMHHWHQLFPDGLLEVRYEDLVDDPEASVRRMLAYLDLDWEPQVLEFHALERPVRTASVYQVRQPLYKTAKARWHSYERQLRPLIAATNRKINWAPIEMVTLPEPGWLNRAVDSARAGAWAEAEELLLRLLHFVPDHAAGHFVLGLVYAQTDRLTEGIEHMEAGLARCPWNRQWRADLLRAYRLAGREDDARSLAEPATASRSALNHAAETSEAGLEDPAYVFLSEERSCSGTASASSGA